MLNHVFLCNESHSCLLDWRFAGNNFVLFFWEGDQHWRLFLVVLSTRNCCGRMIITLVAAATIAAFITTAGNPHIVTVTTFTGTAALWFTIYFILLRIGDWELIIKNNLNIIWGNFVFSAFPLGAACGNGVVSFSMGTCQCCPCCRNTYSGGCGSTGWFC